MRKLEWVRGKSGEEWAKAWGISQDRMNHLAAEAWKRVKAEVTDPDRITVKISTVLEQVIDDAMLETRNPALIEKKGQDGEPYTYQESPNNARKVVVEAAKTWAVIVGANAPTKVQVGFSVDELDGTLAALDQNLKDDDGEDGGGNDGAPAPAGSAE